MAVVLVACGRPDTRPTLLTGVVVDVQAASFLLIATFTLRTNGGTLVPMRPAEGDIGITQSHLRQHMALAEPVAVTVRYDGDDVIAVRIDDAPR